MDDNSLMDQNINETNIPFYKKHIVLLIGSIGVIILLFLVLFIYFFGFANSSKPVEKEVGSVPRLTNPTPNIKNLREVQSEFFRVSIPSSWDIETYGFDGGVEYTFKPISLPPNKLIPGIQVEVYSENTVTTQDFRKKMYRGLQYKEENVSFGDSSAVKFSGTLPSAIQVGGNGVNAQETVYIFQKGQELFVISYKYDGQENVGQKEFETILSTFE